MVMTVYKIAFLCFLLFQLPFSSYGSTVNENLADLQINVKTTINKNSRYLYTIKPDGYYYQQKADAKYVTEISINGSSRAAESGISSGTYDESKGEVNRLKAITKNEKLYILSEEKHNVDNSIISLESIVELEFIDGDMVDLHNGKVVVLIPTKEGIEVITNTVKDRLEGKAKRHYLSKLKDRGVKLENILCLTSFTKSPVPTFHISLSEVTEHYAEPIIVEMNILIDIPNTE